MQISVKRRAHSEHEEAERAKRLHVLNTGFEPNEEGLFEDDDELPAAGDGVADASLPDADGGAAGAAEDDTAAALRELEGNDDDDD